jgi:hypothetical protein
VRTPDSWRKNFIIFCLCPLPRELFCEEREKEEKKRNLHIHNNNNISHFEKKNEKPTWNDN